MVAGETQAHAVHGHSVQVTHLGSYDIGPGKKVTTHVAETGSEESKSGTPWVVHVVQKGRFNSLLVSGDSESLQFRPPV